MSLCPHRTLVQGSSVDSENIFEHDVCGLCRGIRCNTERSCPECGKNICTQCFPQYPDAGFALYLKTAPMSSLLFRTYKEAPESATTLFIENSCKPAVFLARKEMSVAHAKLDMAQASARVAQAESELNDASDSVRRAANTFNKHGS